MQYLLKWIIFPLAFVPLLVHDETLFPFIFPKTLLIRTLVALFWVVFAAWLFMDRSRAKELIREKWQFLKNPVFLFTIGFFIVLMIVSTIFSVNPFRSFFGDVERGEGLLGIFNFIGFFIATLFVFKKEDWITFFRGTLIVGAILFFDALNEFLGPFVRAQSSLGNPTFLAAVFLFIIYSALIVLFSKPTIFWRVASLLMIPLGIVGVFLTGTRGAILGLFFGAFLVVIYLTIKGKDIYLPIKKKISFRSIGVGVFLVGILFAVGFVTTVNDPIWENVPGLGRFAGVSFNDATLQTRLISAGVSLKAINPANESIGRSLVGYGPENFNIAYNKYYNPEYMRYEPLWFDRAHNKVFDVLVMNGALGLIAYLGIWVSLFYLAFRRVKEKGYAVAMLFFSGAYFSQNLFVFDQISTYIPFLTLFAFSIFVGSGDKEEGEPKVKTYGFLQKYLPYIAGVFGIFLTITYFLYAVVPYRQSIVFIDGLQSRDAGVLYRDSEKFLKPYNYIQEMIRNRYLRTVGQNAGNPQFQAPLESALAAHEEHVLREPYDPRDITLLANVYRVLADLGYPGALETSEKYYLMSLELAPARQEHLYSLGVFYASQGRYDEMQKYLDIMMEQSSTVPRSMIFYGTAIFQEGETRYTESMEVLNSALQTPGVYFNQNELGILRNMYQTFGNYQATRGDGEYFRMALEGALAVELFIEQGQQGLISSALVNGLPPADPDKYRVGLSIFDEQGLSGINLESIQ